MRYVKMKRILVIAFAAVFLTCTACSYKFAMDAIIDHFGEDVQVYAHNMTSFRIIVNTAVSHVLFNWIFGFGGKVRIKSPENVKNQYAELVHSVASNIE